MQFEGQLQRQTKLYINKLDSNLESNMRAFEVELHFVREMTLHFYTLFKKYVRQITAGYWQQRRLPTRLAAAREK